MRLLPLLLVSLSDAAALRCGYMTRRAAALAVFTAAAPAIAAEPIAAVQCDDVCMKERIERKQELLRKQNRKDKFDAKIVFGGDYQAGKREASRAGKLPIVGEFLFPDQVGGVNLQSSGAGGSKAKATDARAP